MKFSSLLLKVCKKKQEIFLTTRSLRSLESTKNTKKIECISSVISLFCGKVNIFGLPGIARVV